ncbi:serine protease [Aquabacterium sp.]|uniref:S1 family peptidase n=1 Tax=Aquabacterium sp. TaxID=1872578 RepID=UPI0025BBBB8E|nr:serine protease [Aquabacterium sp.]
MTIRFMPAGRLRAVLCGVAGAWCVATHAASPLPSVPSDSSDAVAAPAPVAASAPEVVSSSAHKLYEQARHQLVQVRTLLSGQGSQSSVGSGFFVGDGGLIITNYHVVSQVALQPQRYRLTYAGVDGRQGALELLAFDVAHDLAVVRPSEAGAAAIKGLAFRPRTTPLDKGERIYSLGNPLDVGFAVVEGTYNGLVDRGFYPTVFFSGSLNPGMSGGPTLDEQGRVMGVNVATRLDGQQVSFLVPSDFAEDLLLRARKATPIKQAVYPELTRQLVVHQDLLTKRFMAQPWRSAGHEHYRIPVPPETFMRCWGNSTQPDNKGLEFERSDCSMNQSVFINSSLYTGNLATRHEIYDGSKLGAWRFARQYSKSFRNEYFGGAGARTAAQCSERFVTNDGLPMRAVICLNAYKKLPGLYDMGVLVATLNDDTAGAQGRFDAKGVSFDNAMKLADFYLKGYGWIPTKKAEAESKRPSR